MIPKRLADDTYVGGFWSSESIACQVTCALITDFHMFLESCDAYSQKETVLRLGEDAGGLACEVRISLLSEPFAPSAGDMIKPELGGACGGMGTAPGDSLWALGRRDPLRLMPESSGERTPKSQLPLLNNNAELRRLWRSRANPPLQRIPIIDSNRGL